MLICALWGCGVDPSQLIVPPRDPLPDDGPLPTVRLATSDQIAWEEVVPDSYIVAFRSPGLSRKQNTFSSFTGEYRFYYPDLAQRFLADARVVDIDYITTVDISDPGSSAWDAAIPAPEPLRLLWGKPDRGPSAFASLAEVKFAAGDAAASQLGEWEQQGKIWFAEPNYLSYLSGVGSPRDRARRAQQQDPTVSRPNALQDSGTAPSGLFTDLATEYSNESLFWGGLIKLVEAFQALAARNQDSSPDDDDLRANGPVIAVLDSGLDTAHPAFEGRLWENPAVSEAGCPDDAHGCDTTVGTKGVLGSGVIKPFAMSAEGACPADTKSNDYKNCTHGTHVSGIVAGKYTQTSGGICPVCKIMTIKIISGPPGKGAAKDSSILKGMKYLTAFVKKGDKKNLVRVANSSFGKYSRSRAVAVLTAVLKAAPNEVLVVGAASNEDSMVRAYPAALNDALAVAAVDRDKQKASYSNFGTWVDIAAPGTGIVAAGAGSQTAIPKNGTSMATPVVAGVAGLLLAQDPGRSFNNLRSTLIDTSNGDDLYTNGSFNYSFYFPPVDGVRQPLLGAGLVDAAAALTGNTDNGPKTVSALRRVDRGCSVVTGRATAGPAGSGTLPLWLALPALLIPIFARLGWGAATGSCTAASPKAGGRSCRA